MSRKREKKIKRLRKYPLLPQIIETYVVELAFIVLAIFIFILDIQTSFYTIATKNTDVCNQIVTSVNKSWDNSEKQLSEQAQTYLDTLLEYDADDFDSICLIDDNNKIINSFGNNVPPDYIFEDFSEKDFKKNKIYFREDYYDNVILYDDDEVEEYDTKSLFIAVNYVNTAIKNNKHLSKFWQIFKASQDEKLSMKEFFDWASKTSVKQSLWVIYKTEIDGVNVAINKVQIKKTIEEASSCFLILIILIVFGFIFIYEYYRLIRVIISRRKFQKVVNTDPMTGGNNKDFFIQKATKIIKRKPQSFTVVYVRMEKYRNYITAYGIREGENLMEDMYKLLTTLVKKRKELVAHLEKSDFILLLHYDNEELLNIRMQAITQALNDCRPKQHLTFSVGACRINTRVDNLEEKISNAGAAISKQENNPAAVLWFDESMREEQIWERRVEDDMDRALEAKEFKVYLQPKYSTKKEELSAAEALVRWIHPEYGFVSPAKFIPIFERNGFITKLDDFMLTEVSKLQAKWLAEGRKLVPISVNVSRAHFSQYDLAEHICRIVDTYKVPHEFIELELTESAFFDDKQILLDTIKKLKDFGFKVSMDDFGAGYSSLNSLKELPLDIIKLDAQFFRDIEDKKRADLIVCDTIKLAKKLGMQIVAEGIETREQVDFLAQQHCDLIQGFYFAKPLPVNEFEAKAFQS